MVNEIEHKLFDSLPFAGTSWAPETANNNRGEYLTGERPKGDGSDLITAAFIEAVITRKQPENIAEESYYASAMALWGDDALQQGQILPFPEEYKLDYLNHRRKQTEATV
jgi:hypothetical protein